MHEPLIDRCPVVELRRYTLHPGRRDALIALFDREFVEPQEAVGLQVIGQCRDLDRPDRFVWLRGAADMAARRRGLEAFYGGPVWAAHRDAANATMIDSDDVHLLRPAWPGATAALPARARAPRDAHALPAGMLDIGIVPLHGPAPMPLLAAGRVHWPDALMAAGALGQAWYVTEPSPNDFPRLPVHVDTPVLVGIALFADAAAHAAFLRRGHWAGILAPALASQAAGPIESHRLAPTARSALHA